jgi:hypothetical protein
MAISIVTGTIAADASLSSALDCTAGRVLRVTTPAAWTPAELSFQVSNDGIMFNDAYDLAGKEYVIPCKANRCVIVQAPEATGAAAQFTGLHLKFRSGPAHAPVPQAALRTFTVAVET